MKDFAAARRNMVDSQIHTMGVTSEPILDAFRTVPRENFVPESLKGIAYNDEDLPIATGRALMEPVTHARLIQAAMPLPSDVVLDVGGATGYSAAILSSLVSRVVAAEADDFFLNQAQEIWAKTGYGNIVGHHAKFGEGARDFGPYSLIFLNGSVAEVPQALIDQLAPHGRLVCVVRKAGDRIGHAIILTRNGEGVVADRNLFDAAVPYLPGLEPRKEFVF